MVETLLFGIPIAYGVYVALHSKNLVDNSPDARPTPLFDLPNPSHLWISYKPPLLGGTPIQKSLKQFERDEGIIWSNVPVADQVTRDRLSYPHSGAKDQNGILPFNDFMICFIDDILGLGVFSTKAIKRDTIVGVYSGIVEYPIREGKFNNTYRLNGGDYNGSIQVDYEARHYRNMVAYIQHAPTELLPNEPDNAVTANLKMIPVTQLGIPISLCVATRDIEPFEQLLLDYGLSYWEERPYYLLDKTSQPIATRLPPETLPPPAEPPPQTITPEEQEKLIEELRQKCEPLQRFFEESPLPLFHAANPTHILYGKSGGMLSSLSLEEFERRENIIWTNSPVTGKAARKKLFGDESFPRKYCLAISEGLANRFNHFAICHINDTVGKGVVYVPPHPDEVLAPNTIVGIYSGLLQSANTYRGFCPYGYILHEHEIINQSVFDQEEYGTPFYDAQHYRNLTSYIQHAPEEETLADLNIPDNLKPIIATANTVIKTDVHLGIPVLYAITTRAIKPGEQLLFDYDASYFEGNAYQLFDKNNNIVGSMLDNTFTVNA